MASCVFLSSYISVVEIAIIGNLHNDKVKKERDTCQIIMTELVLKDCSEKKCPE